MYATILEVFHDFLVQSRWYQTKKKSSFEAWNRTKINKKNLLSDKPEKFNHKVQLLA